MKQVTLYQCSFCERTFFREDECFLHECASHHEMAARQASDLKWYCSILSKEEDGCRNCQFYPSGSGKCFISGKPCEWQVPDKKIKRAEKDDDSSEVIEEL